MREVHAHDAVLRMHVDGDLRAPGGAITLALCGGWDHPPPCPLAPHHTDVDRRNEDVVVRVLFAAEPAAVVSVHERIDAALRGQQVEGPDGVVRRWDLVSSAPGRVRPDELDAARRLASS